MGRTKAADWALGAAMVAGASYAASWGLPLPAWAAHGWKGSGVGLLTLYALLRARRFDGWLLAAVMALGALGDVVLAAVSLTAGGVVFLAGHLVAVWLYLRNRRPRPGVAAALVVLLVPAVAAAAFALPADRGAAAGMAVYAAGGGLMASSAWLSRFPRWGPGLGGLMFSASDLLIFARVGPLAGQAWVNFAVWGLYFAAQVLICVGVATTLDRDARARP